MNLGWYLFHLMRSMYFFEFMVFFSTQMCENAKNMIKFDISPLRRVSNL